MAIYVSVMATNRTLLCIHRDPAQLSLLQENGYELVTATNGHDGLRLFISRPVDAVVLDYGMCLLNGAVVASEIKKVNPQVPIVMLVDSVELPEDALKSVDALVTTSDGPHFLWATVHFILNVQPAQRREGKLKGSVASTSASSRQVTGGRTVGRPNTPQLAIDEKDGLCVCDA